MIDPFSSYATAHIVISASRLLLDLIKFYNSKKSSKSKNSKVSEAEKKYWKAQEKYQRELLKIQQQGLNIQEAHLQAYTLVEQARAEREERALELQQAHLDWLREQQAVEVDLAMKKIQADYDKEHWAGILSRDEMVNILVNGQKQHRLLVIVSEPQISPSCPDTFAENLPGQLRGELKKLLDDLYPLNNNLCPVEFYGKFFKTAVFDTQVKQLETVLSAIPTVVIYSEMIDEKLFLYLHSWGLPIPLSQVMIWDWETVQERLQADGLNEKQSLKQIRQEIVSTHQFLVAFLADIYYLSVNPFHEPRLFQLVRKDELLTKDLARCLENLRQLQDQRRTDYEEELRLLAEQEKQKLAEIRKLEETFEEMQKQHSIVRDRLKQVALEIDESLVCFEQKYLEQIDIAVKRIMLGESVETVLKNTKVHIQEIINETSMYIAQSYRWVGEDVSVVVSMKIISTGVLSLVPFLLLAVVNPAGLLFNLLATDRNRVAYDLKHRLLENKSSLIKKLRKEAEAPALEIEAKLKQEEADLLQLLEEKRKAL